MRAAVPKPTIQDTIRVLVEGFNTRAVTTLIAVEGPTIRGATLYLEKW